MLLFKYSKGEIKNDKLFVRLGIDENDIKNIIEFNNGLTDYEEYDKNIETLEMIGCNDKEIRNIIISNHNILIRSNLDILILIKTLGRYGFNTLNITFDTNPFLLNKDSYEIDEFFKEKRKQNLSDDEIIDLIENEIDIF